MQQKQERRDMDPQAQLSQLKGPYLRSDLLFSLVVCVHGRHFKQTICSVCSSKPCSPEHVHVLNHHALEFLGAREKTDQALSHAIHVLRGRGQEVSAVHKPHTIRTFQTHTTSSAAQKQSDSYNLFTLCSK